MEEVKRDKLWLEKNFASNVEEAIQTKKQNGEVVNETNEQITLLSNKFNKALKKFSKRRPNGDFGFSGSNKKMQSKDDNI